MSVKPRVLIIDKMHDSIVPLLEDQGFEVDYKPAIKRDEIIEALVGCVGMIVRSKTTVDAELLQNAGQLRFMARAGAGIDQLDVEEIESRGISIFNAPEGNRDALGEHALGLLLNLSNNIRQGDSQVRQEIWDREGNRGFELKGKTIGLIGYGFMGSAFAEKLSGFSCKVIAYDKYKQGYSDEFVIESSLEELFEKSDILSLHVPLTDETRFMVDKDFLLKFKPGLIFLNTSRGEVVPLNDLLHLLDEGFIRCAGLDVLENEKLATFSEAHRNDFNRLKEIKNVILTPHVGGWTFESYQRINEVLVDKIKLIDFATD